MELNVKQKLNIEKVAGSMIGQAAVKTVGNVGPTSTVVSKSLAPAGSFISRSAKNLTPAKLTKPRSIKSINNSFTSNKNISNAFTSSSTLQNANTNMGLPKSASFNGEIMSKKIVGNSYEKGVRDAFEKMAMPFPGQPQQMDPAMMSQQMDPNMVAQAMPQNPMGQTPEAPAPMVGSQMDDVQQNMAAQASPEELQEVQNSGITSGDIASAAKVIQTMAEMKASADMAGIAPVDQSGVQAPGGQAPM